MQPSLFSLQARFTDVPRSAAVLHAAGVSRSMTAGRNWQRAAHGYYRSTDHTPTTAQRLVDASVNVPTGGALAGWAAAFVLGVDWCDGLGLDGRRQLPVPISTGPNVHRRSTPLLHYARDRLPPQERQRRHGLPVTTALRTAFDTARWAPSLTETVVALDACAHFGVVRLPALEEYVGEHAGWAGIRQVRAALPLVEPGVRSPWETRLRLVYVLEANLSRPLVNPPVYDDRGRFVGMPDLLDVEAGLAIEYDGSGHRQRFQHNQDNAREEALEDVGLVVVRVDSHDYVHGRPRTGRTDDQWPPTGSAPQHQAGSVDPATAGLGVRPLLRAHRGGQECDVRSAVASTCRPQGAYDLQMLAIVAQFEPRVTFVVRASPSRT